MFKSFGTKELLELYSRGIFPMADGRDDPRLLLIDPELRGIFDLNNFHIPSRLKRTIRKSKLGVTANLAFRQVIENCAAINTNRNNTWINDRIIHLYTSLHNLGHAHSIEVWNGETLVGGLYGVHLQGVFFGESMFSRETDASKIALVHLVAALKLAGFKLLDAQFHNNHLEQFGILEIERSKFHELLTEGLKERALFPTDSFTQISPAPPTSLSSGPYCLSLLE